MRRKGLALRTAARDEGTDPRTVLRYVGSALRQRGYRERYRPTAYDRLLRTLNVLTPSGTVAVTVRASGTASRIAEYMNAVRTYVNKGELSALARFSGKSFRASGASYTFVTDPDTLERLADAGVMAIEQLYRATQGMTT
jgi:hypothetical protein